jgi:NAD(P)-dependent dehydrogenase (short-subunit alcohol dehydrogenase family)
MRRFEGTRVIVTGGARGIGKATVARFAAEGASVVLTDRDRETAEAAAKEISEETSSSV